MMPALHGSESGTLVAHHSFASTGCHWLLVFSQGRSQPAPACSPAVTNKDGPPMGLLLHGQELTTASKAWLVHHRLHEGLWCKSSADSPRRKAGRRPARAGYAARRSHRSRSLGGCTHSGRWVALRPPAGPAPRSAGCSASPSTRSSPGRCQTCCRLGETKAQLRGSTASVTPTAFYARLGGRKRGLTHERLARPNVFFCKTKTWLCFQIT